MVDTIKCCAEINLHYPSLLPTLQFTLQCMGHKSVPRTKVRHMVLRPFRYANWVFRSTPLRSINLLRQTDTTPSNTLDNTDVIEIVCNCYAISRKCRKSVPWSLSIKLFCYHCHLSENRNVIAWLEATNITWDVYLSHPIKRQIKKKYYKH